MTKRPYTIKRRVLAIQIHFARQVALRLLVVALSDLTGSTASHAGEFA
ncbi:hypothetical protein [Pelagicoccus sp. SDUM812003]|nr:hypothetical protein [Pelagicoccus sp. SDUM812003]